MEKEKRWYQHSILTEEPLDVSSGISPSPGSKREVWEKRKAPVATSDTHR